VLAVAFVGALTGCTSGDGATPPVTVTTTVTQPTTVVVPAPPQDQQALNEASRAAEEASRSAEDASAAASEARRAACTQAIQIQQVISQLRIQGPPKGLDNLNQLNQLQTTWANLQRICNSG